MYGKYYKQVKRPSYECPTLTYQKKVSKRIDEDVPKFREPKEKKAPKRLNNPQIVVTAQKKDRRGKLIRSINKMALVSKPDIDKTDQSALTARPLWRDYKHESAIAAVHAPPTGPRRYDA